MAIDMGLWTDGWVTIETGSNDSLRVEDESFVVE